MVGVTMHGGEGRWRQGKEEAEDGTVTCTNVHTQSMCIRIKAPSHSVKQMQADNEGTYVSPCVSTDHICNILASETMEPT